MIKLSDAVKNKWSSALLLTFVVHSIFFIIIFMHVNLRQNHNDPLTQSSTMIGHRYADTPPPLETLTDITIPTEQTAPSSEETVPAPNISETTTTNAVRTRGATTQTTVSTTAPVQSTTTAQTPSSTTTPDTRADIDDQVASADTPLPEEVQASQAPDQTKLSTLQAEAGLLAADIPQITTASSPSAIVTAAAHNEKKQEAETANTELRAAIAAVKARNQQQIPQLAPTAPLDAPTVEANTVKDTPKP